MDINRIASVLLNAAVYQGEPRRGAIIENIATLSAQAELSSNRNVDILLFPELFLTGYDIGAAKLRELAISLQGPEFASMKEITKRFQVAIAVGYPENADDAIYNSFALIDATGEIICNYRKIHLWDDYEKSIFTPGLELANCDIFLPRLQTTICIGLLICFDIEFPEPARLLAVNGAQLILVTTAQAEEYLPDIVPTVTVPSRAYENGVFIMYANLIGICESAEKQPCIFCGQSAVIGPDGRDLVRADKTSEGLYIASLNGSDFVPQIKKNNYLGGLKALHISINPPNKVLA